MSKNLIYGNISAKIPKDVKQYGQKKAIFCTLGFIFGEIIAIIAAYFFSTNSNEAATVITYAVAVIIPFAVTGFPFRIIDRSFIGEIVKVNVATSTTSSMKEGPMRVHQNNQINIYIKENNGNILVKNAYKEETGNNSGFKYYNVGDVVVHIYGTEPIFVLPLKPSMDCKCAVCKTTVSYQDICPSCNHTLIKAEFLNKESNEVQNEEKE